MGECATGGRIVNYQAAGLDDEWDSIRWLPGRAGKRRAVRILIDTFYGYAAHAGR